MALRVCRRLCIACPLSSCAVTILSCGSSPTTPAAENPPVEGVWVGSHTLTPCSGARDFRMCSRFPQTGTLTLTLSQQAGDNVSGTMTIEVPDPSSTKNAFLTIANIPVAGTASAGGALRLKGSATIRQTMFGAEAIRLMDRTTTASNRDMSGQLALSGSRFYLVGEPQAIDTMSTVRLPR